MPKPEEVQDEELRGMITEAHQALRKGDYAESVRRCGDAMLKLLAKHPEMIDGPVGKMIALRWPQLGANLQMKQGQEPRIVFERENFVFSEAITYYEFTLERLLSKL